VDAVPDLDHEGPWEALPPHKMQERSSIGAPEVVRHVVNDVEHTKIILKMAKFYAFIDSYSRILPE